MSSRWPSGPPAHQYFADGMTEALTTQLAKIEALKVISRGAVMRFREGRPAPSAIARELGVATLVEGSALLTESRVRITARLVDGVTDRTLWAESYEGDLHDVLALQSRVARAIVREIRVRVTPEEDRRLARARAVDPVAYQEYVHGLFFYHRSLATDARMFESLERALEHFNAAIRLEPRWADAHGALAQTHLRLAGMSDNHQRRLQEYRRAREIAERALGFDPTVPTARLALARAVFFLDGDWEFADREYREVLRLEPNNADWSYGLFLTYAGRFDEALVRLRHSLERWPTSPFVRFQIGLSNVCAGRLDEAAAQAHELHSRLGDVHAPLLEAIVLSARGQYAQAVALLESRRADLMVNRATTTLQALAFAAAKAGHHERARRAVEEVRALGGDAIAAMFVLEGPEPVIRRLQTLHQTRDYTLLLMRCTPIYADLKQIPEVAAILRDMGIDDP